MGYRENLTLGIDLGIGSCGWAVIRGGDGHGEIVAMGARTFDVPETDKERTPTNQLRRQHRGLRRVLKRRRQRMRDLRGLFLEAGLIEAANPSALKIRGLDPWTLRAEGLDRPLENRELAVVLGHIAKHRGFKSNSKRDRGANAAKDSSAMLKAIAETQAHLADFRTVGEMFAKTPEYARRKRNRDGDYTRSILREDQEREVRLLFDRQRRMGNRLATEELERNYVATAFFQRPLADSESKVGPCPFEPNEKRAAKHSYSFELFRFLSRLAALRIRSGRTERALALQELADASRDFGQHKGLTFKRLRKILSLSDDDRFEGVPLEEEGKRDVVSRSGDLAPGTYALRGVLGDTWRTLLATPDKLDDVAFVLSFREDTNSIREGLAAVGLEPVILDQVMKGVEDGAFGGFRGAGHLSAKACRALLPHLSAGKVYSEACAASGYDHARRPVTDLAAIANPVARKALTEAIKQVKAIVQEYGLPGRIHVELARDVGKSKEERDEIRFGIEKRNKEKDRLRDEFASCVGRPVSGAEDLLRYELWKEQRGKSLYSDRAIPVTAIVASDNSVQVDHILPWSRSGDDSFVNKTLCLAGENQDKKGRTPFEWFGDDADRWAAFCRRVETVKEMKGRKKRNYVLRDASILEEKFRPRNLNDTRYATRILLDELTRWYPNDGKVHVYSRPGPLTDRLRRGWGLQGLKKVLEPDGEKRRADDRHHALDALIVAATSQTALHTLTQAFQEAERRGLHRDFSDLEPPWPGFIEETRTKFAEIFVSRAERRRARGEGHAATIRQIAERDGEKVVYERKAVDALTEKDLERIKDPERNGKLIDSLREWMAAGKPKDRRPLSPKGDAIVKVRLKTNKKPDVLVREGAADRGEMVRVDVFRKKNRKGNWEFFLVPIYPHQVMDAVDWPKPPNKAIKGAVDEDEWVLVDSSYQFCWSLHPLSFVELVKSDGEVVEGYLRGTDRNTGAFTLSRHFSKLEIRKGIGVRMLTGLRKIHVDRLGRRFPIEREIRTWHGVACT